MALPVRKGYKGAAANAVLTNNPTASEGDTIFEVDTVTGWSTTFPYFVVVDPGTSREEKVRVTAISSTLLTVVRAQDDTSVQNHSAGAAVYPVFTADEADEANLIASAMTTKGDLIATDGSSVNRLGVGTNTHVLQADSSSTNGFKWGQVATAGIADDAVTAAKIASAVAGSGLAGGAGTALSVNVDASTIEINSDTLRIKDSGVVTAKLADDAVTSSKIAAPTLTDKPDTFTLALTDENCTLRCSKATVMDVEIPGSGIAFANGAVVTLMQYGAGQVTVKALAGSGVTVRSSNGLKLRAQYSMATLVKISDTEWVLSGDTVA
jgi:hypothetical protein